MFKILLINETNDAFDNKPVHVETLEEAFDQVRELLPKLKAQWSIEVKGEAKDTDPSRVVLRLHCTERDDSTESVS